MKIVGKMLAFSSLKLSFEQFEILLAPTLFHRGGALDLAISLTPSLQDNLVCLSESTSMTTKWHQVSPKGSQMIPKRSLMVPDVSQMVTNDSQIVPLADTN